MSSRKSIRQSLSRFNPFSRKASKPAELMAAAGRGGGDDRPDMLEQLESRQMLFTLTVPGAPGTMGRVEGFFGYAIPMLVHTVAIGNNPTTGVLEDFNTANPADPGANPNGIPINAGQVFDQSNVTLDYSNGQLTSVRLIREDLANAGPNFLRFTMQQGDSFSFRVAFGDQAPATTFSRAFLSPEGIAMDIGTFGAQGAGAFDPATMTVELSFNGQVVSTSFANAFPSVAQPGGGRRYTFAAPQGQSFDRIRFIATVAQGPFSVDNIGFTGLAGNFGPVSDARAFGASFVFVAPAGASIHVLDLYGREMKLTIAIRIPAGSTSQIPIYDADDNGIIDINDGIGQIILTGTDSRSAFTIIGGTIQPFTGAPPAGAEFVENGFAYLETETPVGLYDAFEQNGFGYHFTTTNGTFKVDALPPGPGSVVIGSPWLRPQNNYDPAGVATVVSNTDFSRADQGIFIRDGGSISMVYVHGIVHGSSVFTGFVDSFVTGYMVGSASVAGDLGWFSSGTDAGMWVSDDGAARSTTFGALVVGRTLGEFAAAGRSDMNITVIGDLNSPVTRPARSILSYVEKENFVASNPRNAEVNIAAILGLTGSPQQIIFGNSFLRNDTILGAEWIGSVGTSVNLVGSDFGVGANTNDAILGGFDQSDVFAFAVDGTQDVVIQSDNNFAYMRLLDQDGRTLAATQQPNPLGTIADFSTIRYRPKQPGIIYLDVMDGWNSIHVNGMAPTTFGMFRTASGTFIPGLPNIQVLSGSMGSVAVGTAYVGGDGNDTDPTVTLNSDDLELQTPSDTLTDRMAIHSLAINVAANLYNITGGSGIGDELRGIIGTSIFSVNVGRNFGTLVTGLSGVVGTGPLKGDMHASTFVIGGSIAMIDVRGAIGIDQNVPGANLFPVDPIRNSIVFRTGTGIGGDPTLKGNIGMIRVGSHVGEGTLQVITPDNSVVGGFLVSQDIAVAAGDPFVGIYSADPITSTTTGVDFRLGFNSDLRFFDTPQIDMLGINDAFIALIPGVPVTLTDDGGGTVQFFLNDNGNGTTPVGRIRVLPIAGSLGVAIGRVEVDLSDGGILNVNGVSNSSLTDVISIGRIVVLGASAASSINITGTAEVDVWQIIQSGGEAFGDLANTTPRGDIVSADMVALNSLSMGTGDIGRTQLPQWGPQQIGIFLGITGQGGGTAAGGPIIIPAASIAPAWNGGLYRPVNNADGNIPPGPWLDDVGSPVDPYLNGLMVRTGNLAFLTSNGAIGDVIVNDATAGAGVIGQITANADGLNLSGRPEGEGIFGNIYANRILQVDIGSGLVASDQSPLATSGIVANDDIASVVGGRVQGAYIKGIINAANNVPVDFDDNFPTDGINSITLTNGGIIDKAFIGSMQLDSFWRGLQTAFDTDPEQYRGRITLISGTDVNLFRSQVWAFDIVRIDLNATLAGEGFYDATLTHTHSDINTIIAKGYRNSTLSGNNSEFFPNQVLAGGDIVSLTTYNNQGDIEDLNVDSLAHIVLMSANTITRSTIDADIEIAHLETINDLRSTTVTTGRLTQGLIRQNIRSSQINVAGLLVDLTVDGEATNTAIDVSGPDGTIQLVRVRKLYTGSIRSAGPIFTLEVTEGDLNATLFTSKNQHGARGDIGLIKVGGNIIVDADIDGTITRMVAGGSVGDRLAPKPIVVHGSVDSLEIPSGQLYSDLRIDQGLNSAVIGAVSDKPGSAVVGIGQIIAFGHIESVNINGDFGGKIISWSGGISNVTINNGSLLTNAAVQAFAGDLVHLTINSGHLLGTVHADYILWDITVNASADGVFGDLGVNPALSQGNPTTDPLRNQLPPGVVANSSVQGPIITAGQNIGRITVSNGSIFEAFIFAGRAIGTISVNGDVRNDTFTSGQGTVIAAGSSIFSVAVTGNMANTIILGGVRSFGNDGVPGGVGANADTIRSGRMESIVVGGSGNNVSVSAGMNAGADGIYNTGDERVVLGTSYVRTATFGGGVSNVTVYADSPTLTVSPGVFRAGTTLPLADGDLSNGSPVPGGGISSSGTPFAFNLPGGITGTIVFHGPGQAFYDNVGRRVILINTSLASTLTVSANGTLTDFDIVTNDDASMGSITVAAPLAGDSDIAVDAYCGSITVGNFAGTGTIKVGMNLRSLTTGNFTGGSINAAYWIRDLVVNGNFGTASDGEARIDAYAAGNITINGVDQALVNVERDVDSLNVSGSMNLAQFRAGGYLGSLTSGLITRSRISVRNSIGPIVVNGDVNETSIQAGGDLGDDAAPGGTGFNADTASTGNIASVTVNGNFTRADVVAGLLRGPDGFFGTADDAAAAGRSNIGDVHISGTQVGSNLSSQAYRVSATGAVGVVTLNGVPYTAPGGSNFQVLSLATKSNPLRVQDVITSEDAQVWFATFYFNQDIDAGSFLPALTISEVRNGGLTLVPLVAGTDYVLQPSTFKDRAVIRFSRTVTDRDLIPTGGIPANGGTTAGTQDPNLPGPGVLRFTLSADTFRGQVADARLQGDPALQTTANFSQDVIIGDAGDKLLPEVDNISTGLNPSLVNMYGPADLDLVLDNNQTPDGQPDTNLTYTVRGMIGDHPDAGVNRFGPAADTDVYKITLRAGQILRIGAMQGAANFAPINLFNANSQLQRATTADSVQLPSETPFTVLATAPINTLIKTTGTYFIVISNNFPATFNDPGTVADNVPGLDNTGNYTFTIQVFDDADSGFGAATDSGNGAPVVNAPAAIVFAGANLIFQNPGDPNYDDRTEVPIGDYVFTLDPGADGVRGTADDIVTGHNSTGITSVRQGSNLTSTINSAIGPKGHMGVPGDVAPDADVFVLNNGQTIAAGRTITVKVKLADIGADLGTFSRLSGDRLFRDDFRGDVQFGLFDVTNATGVDDGSLIFSPTDFKAIAQKQKSLATQGSITYGYDANGDYVITFVTTGPIGGLSTDPAKYAIYIQGVFNTDYTIEVTQSENAPVAAVPQARQNILLETTGGTINWLEAGGLSTTLAAFSGAVLGFTGSLNNLPVDDYILTNLVTKLNSIFAANGLNVVFSTNPADFEFQDFSRIFLTSTTDPIDIFNTFVPNFGYSQHSDPFNADRNDEAAIFLPSLGQLGDAPSQAGVDSFVLSLTAAVGRRAGELMGLRIETNDFGNPDSIMAASSVFVASPNSGYNNVQRALSDANDDVVNTNFFIGQQNAFALLDKFLIP